MITLFLWRGWAEQDFEKCTRVREYCQLIAAGLLYHKYQSAILFVKEVTMGAIGVVSLIVALVFYWGFGWGGIPSAIAGAILGPVLVAVVQVTFSSLFGTNETKNTGENNSPTSQPKP